MPARSACGAGTLWSGATSVRRLAWEGEDEVVEAGRSSTAFAKTTQPTMGSVVDREALFASPRRAAGPVGRVDLRPAGIGQDDAGRQLRQGASPAVGLVSGRRRRRGSGELLPLPPPRRGEGPRGAGPRSARVLGTARRRRRLVRAQLLPAALRACGASARARARQPAGGSRRERAAGGARGRLFAGAERLLRHRDQPRRAAGRARAPSGRGARCAT